MDYLPQTLKKLRAFDETLLAKGLSIDDSIGLRWCDESMAYDQTPYDVLPFMDAGADGIHVGLLTDFGRVSDLEEAYVVCIHPMEAPDSLKLLARNPKEFVDFIYSDQDLMMLFNFMMIESEEKYQEMLAESKKDYADNPEILESRNRVLPLMKAYMGCEKMDSVYDYVESVAAARKKQIILPTNDGIGVAAFGEPNGDLPVYPVDPDSEISVEEARAFFESSLAESKLAFIRDAQHAGLIDNYTPLKGFIMSELEKMGCSAEVKRLKSLDW